MFIFLVSLSFVSAGVSVSPAQIERGDNITITIDFDSYKSVIFFYDDSDNRIGDGLDLGCEGGICSGERSFNYWLDPEDFGRGFYNVDVDSISDDLWISSNLFEVVITKCDDGTLVGQCSSDLKYCEEVGILDYNCSVCGCEEGYGCGGDGMCYGIVCTDSDGGVNLHFIGACNGTNCQPSCSANHHLRRQRGHKPGRLTAMSLDSWEPDSIALIQK